MPKKESPVEKSLKDRVRELSALYEVGKSITSTLQLNEVLNLITTKAARIMHAKACSLRLLDGTGQELILRSYYGINKNSHLVKKSLKVGESIAGRVVRDGRPYIINDLLKEKRYKYGHLVKKEGLRSLITVPLIQKNKIIGVLSIYNEKESHYSEEDVRLLSMFASQAAIAIENARLFKQAEIGYLNTIKTLANIIDAKDSYTYGHSERVMENALEIADGLDLSEHEKEILRYASLLHDIGKIGIDIGILRKPAKLSEEEWKVMIMHPVIGSGIVEQIGFLDDLAPIILHHHERFNGTGYPGRLRRNKIPITARILAVADAYESMVSDRPYRKALSKRKAVDELRKGTGTQFDPEVVKIFLKILRYKRR